jgi:hypothetical protein
MPARTAQLPLLLLAGAVSVYSAETATWGSRMIRRLRSVFGAINSSLPFSWPGLLILCRA